MEADILRFVNTEAEVQADIDIAESIYFIRVDHASLKAALVEHCQAWQRHFTKLLNANALKDLDAIDGVIAEAGPCLTTPPIDLNSLTRNIRLVASLKREKVCV